MNSLEALILKKKGTQESFLASLAQKYCGDEMMEEPPEEAFQEAKKKREAKNVAKKRVKKTK